MFSYSSFLPISPKLIPTTFFSFSLFEKRNKNKEMKATIQNQEKCTNHLTKLEIKINKQKGNKTKMHI